MVIQIEIETLWVNFCGYYDAMNGLHIIIYIVLLIENKNIIWQINYIFTYYSYNNNMN